MVAIGTGGQVELYNHLGTVDVVLDVEGYYTKTAKGGAGLYRPLSPSRGMDTRSQVGRCNGGVCTRLGPGQSLNLQIAGEGGVPGNGAEAGGLYRGATRGVEGGNRGGWPYRPGRG